MVNARTKLRKKVRHCEHREATQSAGHRLLGCFAIAMTGGSVTRDLSTVASATTEIPRDTRDDVRVIT